MSQLRKVHRILAFLSFLLPFAVYYMTCYPSISFGESGMAGAAAFYQQIPPGPGGPLWVIVAGTFARLLPGDPAHTLTLFSALCGAVTAMMVYLIVVALLNSPSRGRSYIRTEREEEKDETEEDRDGIEWEGILPLVGGMIAALSFAWFDSQWTNATQITTRSAGTLVVAVVLWSALRWYKSDSDGEPGSFRWLLLAAYVAGLALGVDQSGLAVVPGIAMLVWMRRFVPPVEEGRYAMGSLLAMAGLLLLWYAFGAKAFLLFLLIAFVAALGGMLVPGTRNVGLAAAFLIVFTALGYSLYTHVLLRSEAHPALNMMQTDSEGMPSLRAYISNSPLGADLYESGEDSSQHSLHYLVGQVYTGDLLRNTVGRTSDIDGGPPVWFAVSDKIRERYIAPTNRDDIFPIRFFALPLLLSLIGLGLHLRSDWRTGIVLLTLFFALGPLNGLIWDAGSSQTEGGAGLFTSSLLIVALWIGIGGAELARAVRGREAGESSDEANEAQGGNRMSGVLVLCFILVPLNLLYNGWKEHRHDNDRLPHDFAWNLLQSCEPNAILFTEQSFPLLYLQQVEGMRRDVRVVNPHLATKSWYRQFILGEEEWGTLSLPVELPSGNTRLGELRDRIDSMTSLPLPLNDGKDTVVWNMRGRPHDSATVVFTPEQQVIRAIVEKNRWKRPVYFAINASSDLWGGLEAFFRWEGLAFRVVPEKNLEGIEGFSEFPINYEKMVRLLFPKGEEGFLFSGLNSRETTFTEAEREIIPFYHRAFLALAADALKRRNEPKGCLAVLDGMDQTISLNAFPLPYWTAAAVALLYDEAGGKKGAEKYARHAIAQIKAMGQGWREDPIARRYNPYQTAARMYELVGDYDAAIESYRAMKRGGDADPVIRGLIEELRVERHLAKGDSAAARAELRKIISEYGMPSTPELRNNLEAWKGMLEEME